MKKLNNSEKEQFKNWFDQIENIDNFKSIIHELYVNYRYSYRNILSIVRYNYKYIDIDQIVDILKEFDVKRCSRGEDCKSPVGDLQTRNNFTNRAESVDGKRLECIYCNRFYTNFKRANKEKQNHILEFQKIKSPNQQDEFLVNLYKSKEYNYKYLSAISLRHIDKIVSLVNYRASITRLVNVGRAHINNAS